jgi:hypothetical protein
VGDNSGGGKVIKQNFNNNNRLAITTTEWQATTVRDTILRRNT